MDIAGGLLTVAGSAGAGGFDAWGKDIEKRENVRLSEIQAKAQEKRDKNLARFRDTLARGRADDEFVRQQGRDITNREQNRLDTGLLNEQKEKAEETKYQRRTAEEEKRYQRRLEEKLAVEKQILEMRTEGKPDKTVDMQLKALELTNKLIADAADISEVLPQINEIRKSVGLPPLEEEGTGEFEGGGWFSKGTEKKRYVPGKGLLGGSAEQPKEKPPIPGAKYEQLPSGEMGWTIQKDGQKFLVREKQTSQAGPKLTPSQKDTVDKVKKAKGEATAKRLEQAMEQGDERPAWIKDLYSELGILGRFALDFTIGRPIKQVGKGVGSTIDNAAQVPGLWMRLMQNKKPPLPET